MDNVVKDTATDEAVMRALRVHNPFLARAIDTGKHRHLEGKPQDPIELKRREAFFKSRGIVHKLEDSSIAIDKVLDAGGPLARAMRGGKHSQGRTVWIANAAFEAKQIGAQLGAMGGDAPDNIKKMLETASASPDPFYVTGQDVNLARVKAQMSGDWTGVYKAYKQFTPKAGEVAVRDIQDVLRSMMSYGHKLGLVDYDDPYFGTSMDVSSRLLGSLDPDKAAAKTALRTPSTHRAAEDVAVTEKFVLERSIHYTDALQEVAEDTAIGRHHIQSARKGEGPLAQIAHYFERLSFLRGAIQEINLTKRLARAEEDFMSMGQTYQRAGVSDIVSMNQQTPSGQMQKVLRLQYDRLGVSDRAGFTDYLRREGRYGDIDIDAHMQQMQDHLGRTEGAERSASLKQYLEQKTTGVLEAKIDAQADILVNTKSRTLGQTVSRFGSTGRALRGAVDAMGQINISGGARGAGMAAAGLAVAGGAWSLLTGNSKPARDAPSLVTFNYNEWLENQEQFYGQRSQYDQTHGMHDSGIAGAARKLFTDFGSPYRGIMGSQVVFHDQELLKEREQWLRSQYGAKHFDPDVGLHGFWGPFQSARRKTTTFIPAGEHVAPGTYKSLKGDLLKINLRDGNWKMSVEDADTIVVQRGGVRGALGSFFGMNRSYSFRMAGIDAPETTHGAASYHAPQPGAEAAKTLLQMMTKGATNLELVFDPGQSTYGRMMGAVIADGKNVNFELVKQGAVAALPFYAKGRDPMIQYSGLLAAEARAHTAGRGIWSQPYYKAFWDVTKGRDENVTFNTLTRKNKIVRNVWQMDMLSLMETSQAQGFYSTAQATESARVASTSKGHRGPDRIRPNVGGPKHSHYNTYLSEMMRDVGTWTKTHGTGRKQNKFKSKGNYGKLDKGLALDTLGSTDRVWNRRRLQAFEHYGSGKRLQQSRKQRMAAEQRRINQEFGSSPINHHMM
jgi:endonuclease YncB( thermonuclease family)